MSEEKRVATAEILDTSVHVSVKLNDRYQGPPGPPGKDGTVRFEDLTEAQIEQLRGPQGLTGKTPQITVQVETGEPGTEASVVQSGTAEAPVIALTIPRGNVGATPQITVQVKTGEPGTAASVKQTGTAEAPVIELTIPRGDTGSLGSLTINGKAPDAAGKVTLTAADVDAAPAAELSQLKTDVVGISDIISDAWSADKTYAVGDYCIYKNALWRCTAATIGAEHAPTDGSSEWVKCTVTKEIKSIAGGISTGFIRLNDNFEYQIKNGYCTLIGRSFGTINVSAKQYVNMLTLPQNARPHTETVESAIPLGNNYTIFVKISIDGNVDIWSYEDASYWVFTAIYPV